MITSQASIFVCKSALPQPFLPSITTLLRSPKQQTSMSMEEIDFLHVELRESEHEQQYRRRSLQRAFA